jgi:hypothetical protein
MSTCHQDKYTFLIIFCSGFLKMTNFPDKRYRENNSCLIVNNFSSEMVPFIR